MEEGRIPEVVAPDQKEGRKAENEVEGRGDTHHIELKANKKLEEQSKG